ncbi:metallophosphoesterase [Bradyrhizobium macuxiense]|uniref:Metallophosphoesterase n=1 Tax=Bradyrhizobium macuxiense TaxID=1755647 RepID=A0A109JPY2_9BRAD|nr:metallophosphoesterase [Bradyrhizobium macuxiense]KWV52843.1 metallophosphoesterase [Bradyrhizobium macuxiense]
MSNDLTSFTFASVGDLHVKDGQSGSLREVFQEISKRAGALVLCGDLTDTGTPAQAELLVEQLRACSIPMIGVLGNHDYESECSDQVKRILCDGGVRLLDGQATEVEGVTFIGVKGFAGGFGPRMLSSFGEPAIKTFVAEAMNEAMRLENVMRTVSSQRAVVVLHYAPIVGTVEGEPLEIYPFLGCSRLAETIDRFKVSAVVHGHAHRGKYEGRTPAGAPVYNVAMAVQKPSGLPYALLSV